MVLKAREKISQDLVFILFSKCFLKWGACPLHNDCVLLGDDVLLAVGVVTMCHLVSFLGVRPGRTYIQLGPHPLLGEAGKAQEKKRKALKGKKKKLEKRTGTMLLKWATISKGDRTGDT